MKDRVVLSAITWNTTVAPGGDWDLASNWTGGKVPTASDTATISLTTTGSVFLNSSRADAVSSLTTNGNTTLIVGSGSLAIGQGAQRSSVPSRSVRARR